MNNIRKNSNNLFIIMFNIIFLFLNSIKVLQSKKYYPGNLK